MADDVEPAVARWRLRLTLRALRTQADETQRHVAKALDWHPSKLMRIEGGDVTVATSDLLALLAHYGTAGAEQTAELVALARASRRRSVTDRFTDVTSKASMELLQYEGAARTIKWFESQLIPGMLQTEDYARSIIRAYARREYSDSELERKKNLRLDRLSVLEERNGPDGHFIIDEAAMRRRVGAESGRAETMIEQLKHLKTLAANPRVEIQIVTYDVGAYRGMNTPFELLEFDDPPDGRLLFLEGPQDSSMVHEATSETADYLERFDEMRGRATRPDDIDSVLDKIIAELAKDNSA